MTEGPGQGEGGGRMRERRTTLEDGRYLIYYTFDGEDGGGEGAASERPEPSEEAEAERNV
ncbi:MAG: hypothetical protein ABR603_17095 [Pyrinomonadaceae bacterium]